MFLHDTVKTPIGDMDLIVRDGVVLLLEFSDAKERVMREMKARFGDMQLTPAKNPAGMSDIVHRYFKGDLKVIDDLATDGGGTDFEKQVWAELRKIPCGTTVSYGLIAKKLGDIQLSRAVGTANGKIQLRLSFPVTASLAQMARSRVMVVDCIARNGC